MGNISDEHMSLDPSNVVKTLGLRWNPTSDEFLYIVNLENTNEIATKISVLSKCAKLYDPLGILGPVIVVGKLLIQQLWKLNLEWDEPLPKDLQIIWKEYVDQLSYLNDIRFKRCITVENFTDIQVHGFCDASEKAYGACLYLRSTNDNDDTQVSLICSQSRVAPLKSTSLPRLELCSALLLAEIYETTMKCLKIQISETFFWSDSMIALSWINTSPHLLEAFLANRVSKIQTLTKAENWRHVPTESNPSDMLSRGLSPREFIHNRDWKNGPSWLQLNDKNWPQRDIQVNEISGLRKVKAVFSFKLTQGKVDMLTKYSSWQKTVRIVAYCLRFISNAKNKVENSQLKTNLSENEINSAKSQIIKLIQAESFSSEKRSLSKNQQISKDSKLIFLNPFLDQGVLKVGGRLNLADLPESKKHPIVLPKDHHITKLIIKNEHMKRLHAGVNSTLCGVRETYWPIDGLAVFVCFATKAVHLELASDLTTEAFLACLKRFFARRGISQSIHSDNATNFVGTNNEIKELFKTINTVIIDERTKEYLSNKSVSWHFIPPRAPHFGGLWEAAVKSFKFHFVRVTENSLLTYEQLHTYVTEIESILNSRPLTPLLTDPNDLNLLTPAHFLLGGSLTSLPQEDLRNIPEHRLNCWQLAQKMRHHFWDRWHKEYLNELICRSKWQSATEQSAIQPGILILSKEDDLPPMKWPLGRVVMIHRGSDGIVRAVTIKTKSGHDDASIVITNANGEVTVNHNEIHHYEENRYVGPVEAVWRILSKPLKKKNHSVNHLPIHLPNEQNVIIREEKDSNVKGATSFESFITVNGVVHESFTTACLALGLAEDDSEWIRTIKEAALWMMPHSLRQLFTRILIQCHPVHLDELYMGTI
ncbi:uncharacterized protein LOC122509993 [Leptopilina heterotoma]|uniref:uncharacterized protein LOC122509993 n=1 Tax=Leptopilina heterotoma TaxID=63436 RepID=UPI001CA91DCB|nr:uncharacterized protein LOC122509993 [Leptopilina heterotoma]